MKANRTTLVRTAAALVAATLVGLSAMLPLWSMTLKAPQYPKGLRMHAYGTGMQGDLHELNILNHYIGMPPIEAQPPIETALFPLGVAALAALCLLAPVHRWIRRATLLALVATPIGILIDLQWRLYAFGHTLNPKAPIRLEPFTPIVLGVSKLGNFVTTSTIASGFLCLLGAAVVLALGERLVRRPHADRSSARATAGVTATAAGLLLLAALPSGVAAHQSSELQGRLAMAAPGSTIVVDGGVHQGPIVIHGPVFVVGRNAPIIDGGGAGSVVTIDGDQVVFSGFVVRNSGRYVTEEAAGITATGNRHRIEHNDVHDVYFGIHIAGGQDHIVQDNRIAPGEAHGARPGHGISLWHTRGSQVRRNRISNARDGIYLSFTDGIVAAANEITGCRYGMHSMSSLNVTFESNRLIANLLGAALMQSDRLVLRGNRIERHREGSAAYGLLLKDIGDLLAEDNEIVANRVGIYAEGVSAQQSSRALVRGNIIAGNEVGLSLQSNAALTLTANRIADNLTDVRPLGRRLSSDTRWSVDGRGNSWSQYRGYDADGDGIGDLPHRMDGAMDALVQRAPLAQAFLYTPAHLALEAAARMFPLYRQEPLLIDDYPLMTTAVHAPRDAHHD
jgi:nitrous oxidase accessory protein